MARQRNTSTSGARGAPPVSKHPLFPAMVALWFAALFGLGSLAIRPALIESLVLATGIEHAIPGLTPPLALVGRATIALALSSVGGLLGLIAGRIVSSAGTRRRDSQPVPFSQPVRPFSAQELAEVTFDEPFGAPDCGPDPAHEDDNSAACAVPPKVSPPPVDLSALQRALLSERVPPRPVLVPAPEPAPVAIDLPAEPERARPAPLGKAARRLLAADLATLTPVQLVERLGLSMQLQRAAMPPDAAPAPRPMPETSLARAHTAPARIDNEQMLRSALTALQRLSGAA